MTFDPLLSAALPVQVHILAACVAIACAPLALLRRSRDRWHRLWGRVFVLAMLLAALSSFLIHGYRLIGPFSPIHVLSVMALWSMVVAVRAARSGDTVRHRAEMHAACLYALAVPGVLSLVPGRTMSRILFPTMPWIGFLAALFCLAVAFVRLRYRRDRVWRKRS